MKKLYKIPFMLILAVAATVLCGCPPLHHKIFVRNRTKDTVNVTLLYASPFDTMSKRNFSVRSENKIVAINNRSLSLLNDSVTAHADRGEIVLAIPPESTAFISDIINSFSTFAGKKLVIRHAGHADTMSIDYPYNRMENVKRKRDKSYNYFYRTIIYHDIK